MPIRWQEVAVALLIVLTLIGAKHIPALAYLPLSQLTGIFCFSYAIVLSVRLFRSEEAARLE